MPKFAAIGKKIRWDYAKFARRFPLKVKGDFRILSANSLLFLG